MDNKIIHQARLHWIIFLKPMLLLIAALYLATEFSSYQKPLFIVAIVALVWGLMIFLNYRFSLFIIKNKQVILKTGILVRQTLDIPLTKIESIDIRQPLLGSMLHYGSLEITGTGGTRQLVHYINRPLTCRRHIEQLM